MIYTRGTNIMKRVGKPTLYTSKISTTTTTTTTTTKF
jgi:hypothetical protein